MEHSPQEVESFVTIDLKHLFEPLRRWAWLLWVAVLLGMAIAYLLSRLQPPAYQASTQVMITRPELEGPVTDITQALNSQQLAQTYVELLSQRWLLDRAAENVGGSISTKQVKVSAAANTQIITILVEDRDPARATRIADTLVQVLIEQNEEMQSGRYADAESSLEGQIQQVEEQIAGIQAQLQQARLDAFLEQVAAVEGKIEATQAAIATAQVEIADLHGLTVGQARMILAAEGRRLPELQTRLAGQLTEEQRLAAEQELQSLQEKTAWLTPLVEPGMLEKTLIEKQEKLVTQQALLFAYQQMYVKLLTSGKIEDATDRIADLELNLALYREIYLNLLDDREAILLLRMQNMPNVVQLDPANVSRQPVRSQIVRNTLLGGLAFLVVALVLLFVAELSDDTIKNADQVRQSLRLPVIGSITETRRGMKAACVFENPRARAAEEFRILRTNLGFESADNPIHLLVVASPGASKSKSGVAVNLAIALAQGGKRILLIDADLRHPQVHRYLGLSNSKGLRDMIESSLPFEQAVFAWKEGNLYVIASGDPPSNPADLLASGKLTGILESVREKADIVVIDAPPFLVADASILAAQADGVLLVIQPGRTPLDATLLAMEQLKRSGARVLGVVLHRVPRGAGSVKKDHEYYWRN